MSWIWDKRGREWIWIFHTTPGPDHEALLAELKRLQERDKFLSALEAAGVDNWDGYDYARELMDND